ncbi:MAG: M48 family metalloprotease [Pyrinomonadaceae bacterium]|nr:M48 family metalloprotease [Pyrinomonadaceae bacterium]
MMSKHRNLLVYVLTTALAMQLACGGGGLPSLRGGGGNGEGTTTTGGARPAPHFKPGFNIFSPEQDIQMGRQSAQQIAQQVPLLQDEQIVNYVRGLGNKLADKAPGFDFTYQFNVIATKDINAFALPGGYIFVNAGAIAAAKNEGELAGVIAHEITHVALRHGTNQASKAYIAQKGLGIIEAITGGRETDLGQAVGAIGGLGANALFLKFGRTAEQQADLEGARILAAAGYDPRDMANFFKTLEQQGGGQRVPEFLSDHPDPGNRIAAINEALPGLGASRNPVRDSEQFKQVRARLTGGGTGRALTSSDKPARTGPRDPNDIESSARPAPPIAEVRQYQSRDGSFAFEFPANWDGLVADETNMIFAPKGAYGEYQQSLMVTHGIFIGAVAPGGNDLAAATEAFVRQQLESNPDFRVARRPAAINFNGQQGYVTIVAGPSPVTGAVEIDAIYTTATADGRLFYLIAMAPEDEYPAYQPSFERIINSIRLAR